MAGVGLVWDLLARDQASPAFLKVAGAADKAAAATARAQKSAQTFTGAAARTGAVLSKKLTLPLLAVAAVSVDQAAKFQKSMTLIQTAGGETAAKTAEISKGIKKLAVETGTSLDALSEGIYTVAKAGAQKWTATEQLLVLKAAAQGAKAEQVDLGVATDALSTVMLDYHLKASQAVETENQLIKASGLAKTNFSLFSTSLSNVTPIAAALGISFDQVGGAIATMTQHGVSAQQATENLRNLLFNLSGQNNVAAAAMQQLGINTVALQQSLSKPGGLVNALKTVDKALAEHTKNGMVTVDITKAATLAQKSLRQEMGTFGAPLRAQSQGLLRGTVSIKDYTKYAKDLGGQAGAGALQFLALYKSALGFNNQLRNGKGVVSTTTDQYRKLLGGFTAASVAMQIAGKYAADNARNVREIGKAAHETTGDVLGWDKTQETLSVKMAKAKAALQVLSVEIGSALIPAVSKIVGWISRAVHWFDSLSGTQKKVLLWSAAVLAAMGPILTIGTRLILAGRAVGVFTSFMATRLVTLAGATEVQAARVGVAMRGMTSALAGAGIGFAIGSLTQNASKGQKAIGALASTATGAAIGFGVGGPWGAAIGGAAGLLGNLATNWFGSGDAAQKAADKQKAAAERARQAVLLQSQAVDTLNAAIKTDSNLIGLNARAQVVADLQKNGTLRHAQNAGLNVKDITDATLGNKQAQARLQAQIQKLLLHPGIIGGKGTGDAAIVLQQLQKEGVLVGKAGQDADIAAQAMGALNLATRGVVDQTLRYGTTLDKSTVAGQLNVQFIHDHIAALDKARATGKLTDAQWAHQVDLLQYQLKQYGFNKQAVAEYIAQFTKMPKSVITKLLADPKIAKSALGDVLRLLSQIPPKKDFVISATDSASQKLAIIYGNLRALQDKTINIDTYIRNTILPTFTDPSTTHDSRQPTAPRKKKALGGYISGPGGPTSDSIPAWLSNGEFVTNARQTKKHRRLLEAINRGARGFASGGLAHNGTAVSSAIDAVGQVGSPRFQITDSSYQRVMAQIQHAYAVLAQQFGTSAAAGFRKQLAGMVALANRELSQLRVKISGSDLTSLRNALRGTVDDTKSAIGALIADLRASGASAGVLNLLQRGGNALASVQGRLASARDYGSTISGTLSGAFDPTKYGSVTDLIAGLSGASASNRAYGTELNTLRGKAKGNAGLLGFINQLAASGNSSTLQALAGASSKDLAQVAKAVGGYNSSLAFGSGAAEQVKFGQTVTQLVAKQDKLMSVFAQLTVVLAQVAARPIQIDGHAQHVVDSKEMAALIRELETVIRQS